ncbi:MAG: hydrogenase [Epsilonproteobacteria bacterium]|nr:hydrogenase [Campylobacterota bacterium]
MRIALLCSAFNSLSQSLFCALKDRGDEVGVVFAIEERQMRSEIEAFNPEMIIAPFLKHYLPASIYEKTPTYIFHPGPRGDRGAHALEYALRSETKQWGAVLLKANSDYDGGDIYAKATLEARETYKASLYRQEVTNALLGMLGHFFSNVKANDYIAQVMNPLHLPVTQEVRRIDWHRDKTQTIIDKVFCADSDPGVLDEILGVECYLFGAHREDKLRGSPKEVVAKRDGAICLGTIDGAVWITHLKAKDSFKLPATYLLKERLAGVKEQRLPLIFDKSYETFYEISSEWRGDVVYLCFNFHNGAMHSEQCVRLKYAIEYLKNTCKVLVLVGGMDFFSNGIHLNILEDSQKQGEDGWSNINAMNDLIETILFTDEIVTVASLARNAGAGGVFMALACDHVVAKEGVVLNPHYKSLGLSGSEYHSYTLPKRVGDEMAFTLLEEALPISVEKAKKIGMIDAVYDHACYYAKLDSFCQSVYSDDFIWEKQEYLENERERIEVLKERELTKMYPEFWDEKSDFHHLRKAFVYKTCATETPQRLKGRDA